MNSGKSKGLILVTSDVSARGVIILTLPLLFRWVCHLIESSTYIDSVEPVRKAKKGRAYCYWHLREEFFLCTIKDLPITKAQVPSVDLETRKKVERALSHVEMKNKEAAYQAWLSYYNSNKNVGQDKQRLLELANEFSRCMGLDNPSTILKLVLGGLRNVPGLYSK